MSTSCMRYEKYVLSFISVLPFIYALPFIYFKVTCLKCHFQAIPFADKFIFEDGKHNLHLKYKDQFNALVSDFLVK